MMSNFATPGLANFAVQQVYNRKSYCGGLFSANTVSEGGGGRREGRVKKGEAFTYQHGGMAQRP